MIRRCTVADLAAIDAIVNDAARAFATKTGWIPEPLIPADDSDPWPGICSNDPSGDGPNDDPNGAAHLAHMFRVLAAFFFDLSCEAAQLICGAGQQAPGCPGSGGPNAARLYSLLAASRPRYADSS